jgi:D-alanine-D-alanine ligase
MSHRSSDLAYLHRDAGSVVGDARPGARVAVIAGADAQRHHHASMGARALANGLRALGCDPVAVGTGRSMLADLQASGAETAVCNVLDVRLADGTLQEACADMGVRCVGAPALALRACADRAVVFARLAEMGVRVPPQRLFTREAVVAAGIGATLERALQALGEELVVKPRRGAGGLGVKRVDRPRALAAITNSFNYDDAVIAETAVNGQELTVLMTGDVNEPLAVGAAEISYVSDDELAPAWARRWHPASGADPEALHAAVRVARETCWALGLSGLSTVDVIVDAAGLAWVIDVDAMLDWQPDGPLAACLSNSEVTVPQMLAGLLRDAGAAMRLAA